MNLIAQVSAYPLSGGPTENRGSDLAMDSSCPTHNRDLQSEMLGPLALSQVNAAMGELKLPLMLTPRREVGESSEDVYLKMLLESSLCGQGGRPGNSHNNHRVLDGAPPRGRQLYFAFQALQTRYSKSTVSYL